MDISLGKVYKHKKGGKYLVLHIVEESTNGQEGSQGVVYVSLKEGSIYHRNLSEFVEEVKWPDGKMRPRFVPEDEADI